MPSSPNYKRDYSKSGEGAYHASKTQKKNRAARNKVRRAAKGQLAGKDIDHIKPLRGGGSKSKSNTRVRSITANRSDNGHKPGEKQKKRSR